MVHRTAVTRAIRKTLLEFALVRRVLIIFVLVSVAICAADTIRLKNGRSIDGAENIREKDGKVEYEIGDNTYRIPKSMVEKIESSIPVASVPEPDLGPVNPAARPKPDEPRISPPLPRVPSAQDLKIPAAEFAKIVHDGKVDLDALNALESAGNFEAAAAGYFIAGRYEFDRGDRESAKRYFERSLSYAPDNATILAYYAALLVQLGRARDAINYAYHATLVASDSADTWSILGYAYFSADRTRDAIPAWEKSLDLRYDKRVEEYLAKAKREQAAEANYTESETGRFTLRYEGAATKDTLRQQIVAALDKDFDDLSAELGITPYQNIPVILYTEQAFFDVTQAPAWTGALNDGKLRIPVQGVEFINPEMARVLKHELAHSFINQASGGRCPQWLNEGIAQLSEGRPLGARGVRLAQLYKNGSQMPLQSLEKSFLGFSRTQAILAYDESLAAATFISDTYGMSDVRRILEHLGQGGSTEDALRDVLRLDYPQFEQEFALYIAQKYGS
jgi:tetratricopeptide (TPR) repeat protein